MQLVCGAGLTLVAHYPRVASLVSALVAMGRELRRASKCDAVDPQCCRSDPQLMRRRGREEVEERWGRGRVLEGGKVEADDDDVK